MAKYPPDKRPPPTEKKKQPWDRPAAPKKGDDKRETTFTAVGHALSLWEDFETSYAQLFSTIIGVPGESFAATRAYGAILTFKGRSDMVREAGAAYFYEHPQKDLQAEFNNLVVLANGLSGRRNEIAHGVVRHLFVPGRVIGTPERGMMRTSDPWGYAVIPPEYMTGKNELTPGETLLHGVSRKPQYTYTSIEIAQISGVFATLNGRTINVTYDIGAWIMNVVRRASP